MFPDGNIVATHVVLPTLRCSLQVLRSKTRFGSICFEFL